MKSILVSFLIAFVAIVCTNSASPSDSQPAVSLTPTPASNAPLMAMNVEQAFPAISFDRMVSLAYPDDGTNRLFLALQPGRGMVFPNEQSASSAREF
ncbi:MAG: hypothetical protein IIC84_03170, partial [Chloroflexi bacterium]|nr:hypothetical protein [Chloroflexota bacterium]